MKKIKKKGFTLAEVLITLTIIGVVAALTIPTLVQKTNKQEYVSALKKTYSTLSQAANIIIAENGSPKPDDGGWAGSSEQIYEMFKKYLNNIKECGGTSGCFASYYKSLNKSYGYDFNSRSSAEKKLVLADGASILFQGNLSSSCTASNADDTNDTCSLIYVDINGLRKPNTMGRDFFQFKLTEKGIYPRVHTDAFCVSNGVPLGGESCSYTVLREGAMNY